MNTQPHVTSSVGEPINEDENYTHVKQLQSDMYFVRLAPFKEHFELILGQNGELIPVPKNKLLVFGRPCSWPNGYPQFVIPVPSHCLLLTNKHDVTDHIV